MKNPTTHTKHQNSTAVTVAILSLIGVCITTLGFVFVGIFPNILNIFESNPNNAESITLRVTDIDGVSVSNAKVILLSGNDVHVQYTDSNGSSIFNIIKEETFRIFIETNQYEIYDQIFSSNASNPIEIRLSLKDISKKSAIVRVIDSTDNLPIRGAEVILIVNGNVYSQVTDSNGITKFITGFPSDEIEADISVSFSGFKTEHQKVTLQSDSIQDIRLDKTSGTLTVSFIGQVNEVKESHESNSETKSSGTGNSVPQECINKTLSPEECINSGQNTYSVSMTVIDSDGITTCDTADGITTITFNFTDDGTLETTFSDGMVRELSPTTHNTYSGSWTEPENLGMFNINIIFNEHGFEEELSAVESQNNTLVCKWLVKYTFVK